MPMQTSGRPGNLTLRSTVEKLENNDAILLESPDTFDLLRPEEAEQSQESASSSLALQSTELRAACEIGLQMLGEIEAQRKQHEEEIKEKDRAILRLQQEVAELLSSGPPSSSVAGASPRETTAREREIDELRHLLTDRESRLSAALKESNEKSQIIKKLTGQVANTETELRIQHEQMEETTKKYADLEMDFMQTKKALRRSKVRIVELEALCDQLQKKVMSGDELTKYFETNRHIDDTATNSQNNLEGQKDGDSVLDSMNNANHTTHDTQTYETLLRYIQELSTANASLKAELKETTELLQESREDISGMVKSISSTSLEAQAVSPLQENPSTDASHHRDILFDTDEISFQVDMSFASSGTSLSLANELQLVTSRPTLVTQRDDTLESYMRLLDSKITDVVDRIQTTDIRKLARISGRVFDMDELTATSNGLIQNIIDEVGKWSTLFNIDSNDHADSTKEESTPLQRLVSVLQELVTQFAKQKMTINDLSLGLYKQLETSSRLELELLNLQKQNGSSVKGGSRLGKVPRIPSSVSTEGLFRRLFSSSNSTPSNSNQANQAHQTNNGSSVEE